MTILDGAVLGAIQGLTEFLPVSSSGHLILMREVLHLNTSTGLAFDAILQLGTVLAALVYFRQSLFELIVNFFKIISGKKNDIAETDRALLSSLVIATMPAVLIGILLEKKMETLFRSPWLVAIALILGSILLIIAERSSRTRSTTVTVRRGWWIGCFQTLALIPGVSRSGATISGGMLLGLNRETATRYSFLLSLPIITGSGLKKLVAVLKEGAGDIEALPLIIGFCVSFFVGIVCIHYLLAYLKKHTLYAFVWYRCVLALLVLSLLVLKIV